MKPLHATAGAAALLAALSGAALANHDGGLPHSLGGLNPAPGPSISATAPAQPGGGGRPRFHTPQPPGVISGTAPSNGNPRRMHCRFC